MTDPRKKREDEDNRFIWDGSGLIIDDSQAEGEPFDLSPWVEGEDEDDLNKHRKKAGAANEKKIPSRFVETGRGLEVDTSKAEGPAISWWLDGDSDDDDKATTDA